MSSSAAYTAWRGVFGTRRDCSDCGKSNPADAPCCWDCGGDLEGADV